MFLSKLWGYIAGLGGLILVVLGALGLAKRSGVKEQKEKETEQALKQAKEASEIDTNVHGKSDSSVADELRKYQRD